MNLQIENMIDQHQIDLLKVKEVLNTLTHMLSDLDKTASILHILTNDMFISYEISNMNMNFSEDMYGFRLYEDVNNAYYGFTKKYEELLYKQHDIEFLYKLYNNE